MDSEECAFIPLPPEWKPEDMAEAIHAEAEKRWNAGWVFVRAETDALMESLRLYFTRVHPSAA